MSEKSFVKLNPEHIQDSHESIIEKGPIKQEKRPEVYHEKLESLEDIRKKVFEEADTSKEIHFDETKSQKQEKHYFVTKDLKELSYKRTIKRVQQHLSTTSKSFSKIVHQKNIEKISEFGSKTIARPYGIIGGSITAVIGCSVLLYMSKHFGYGYNYSIFFLLFCIGFIVTTIIELISKTLIKKHRRIYS